MEYQTLISRHNFHWKNLPLEWNEGAFLGNGQLGIMVHATPRLDAIVFHLGRVDVTDHRMAPDSKTSLGVAGACVRYDFPRLDIGKMVFRPSGGIREGSFELDIWNAELRAKIVTSLGEFSFRVVSLREKMLQVIELQGDAEISVGDWEFIPGEAISPRFQFIKRAEDEVNKEAQEKYLAYFKNPPAEIAAHDADTSVCVQPLLAGGDYATAWRFQKKEPNRLLLIIATINEIPRSGVSAQKAVEAVAGLSDEDWRNELRSHRLAWEKFYRKSAVVIDDVELQAFWIRQMYKMGSAVRKDGPALDLAGPWYRPNLWPGMWWNLNIQLTYFPFAPANHLDLSSTLIHYLDAHFDAVCDNGWLSGSGITIGDMAWALHSYWNHYRFAGDWVAINDKWVPKAKKVIACYQKQLVLHTDGKWHLRPMGSPEYGGFEQYPDTNYNLQLLHWLLKSLIESAHHCSEENCELSAYQTLLDGLAPFPVDQNGLMIAVNQGLERSHRHFSHFIGFYPLFIFDPQNPSTRELLLKTLQHWLELRNPNGSTDRCGFTLAIAASQYACLNLGDKAYELIKAYLSNDILKGDTFFSSRLHYNTFHTESAGICPVMETPLAIVNAIMELLLQSRNGVIHIFPAVPKHCRNLSFEHLRAQGGFLVSAEMVHGKITQVTIKSLAGEPLDFCLWPESPHLATSGEREFSLIQKGENTFSVDLDKGETVTLKPINK